MNNILSLNKKGISEIVSYVLMIVVVIGISIAVGSYLRVQVPKDKFTCSEDIALLLDHISCFVANQTGDPGTIAVTYRNTGLFTIDAVYARLGESGRRVKTLINDPNEPGKTTNEAYEKFYFIEINESGSPDPGLKPGHLIQQTYSTNVIKEAGKYDFEAQPAVVEQGKLSICPTILKQTITCS